MAVAGAPTDETLKPVAKALCAQLEGWTHNGGLCTLYDDETAALAALSANKTATAAGCVAAVVFDALHPTSLPPNAAIRIRLTSVPGGRNATAGGGAPPSWMTASVRPAVMPAGPRLASPAADSRYGAAPGYVEHGFLALQRAAYTAVSNVSLDAVVLQRFPYPTWTDSPFATTVSGAFPLLFTLSVALTVVYVVRGVVHEKETGMKEMMRMMGVSAWVQWAAWFAHGMLLTCFTVTCILIVFTVFGVLRSSYFVLFLLFILFGAASLAFACFVSTLFRTSTTAAAASAMVWLLAYLPYRVIAADWASHGYMIKLAASLLPPSALGMAAHVLAAFEAAGSGVQLGTLGEPVSVLDQLSFGSLLGMLLLDTVFFMMLALYLDRVVPGAYVGGEPWYFPLLPRFWCGDAGPVEWAAQDAAGPPPARPHFEPPAADASGAGVRIAGLCKTYGNGDGAVHAVADATLDLYEGDITVLLGHNGAGKTTTISMLSGMLDPTGGTAFVNGRSIRTERLAAQAQLGVCTQHDALFTSLSVMEHLWLFAKLKQVPDKEVYRYIDEMLADLQLLPKRHATSASLSGGMRRKLCCGLALVGGSPVVILDEPTSGCDPSARRAIWELLLKNRDGRTMLLSTHHMDEADVLGDRVAIMADGMVHCAGSPAYLKAEFDIGYRLALDCDPGCDADAIQGALNAAVPGSRPEPDAGRGTEFVLPRDSTPQFPALFAELDRRGPELGVRSYGVSMLSIEEAFLRVGQSGVPAGPGPALSLPSVGGGAMDDGAALLDSMPVDSVVRDGGWWRVCRAVRLLVGKRLLQTRRDLWTVAAQLLVPFALTAAVVALVGSPLSTSAATPPLAFGSIGAANGAGTAVVVGPELSLRGGRFYNAISALAGPSVHVAELPAAADSMSAGLLGLAGRNNREAAVFHTHDVAGVSTSPDGRVTAWFNGQASVHPAPARLAAPSASPPRPDTTPLQRRTRWRSTRLCSTAQAGPSIARWRPPWPS